MASNKRTADLLPEAGEGRYWLVELMKRRENNPIKVTLMQSLVPGRKGLAEEIGHAFTVAVPEKVRDAADLVLVKVGGYESVIGTYGEPTGKGTGVN